MSTIQETLDYILKAIVTDSSSIQISDRQEGEVLIMEITAAPEMIGQIIGKDGKIIKSIRTILNLTYPNLKYSLDVKG
jgi:uncharacterized protein